MTTAAVWVAEQLAKAPAMTEQQRADVRRLVLTMTRPARRSA